MIPSRFLLALVFCAKVGLGIELVWAESDAAGQYGSTVQQDFMGQALPGVTATWFAAEPVSQGQDERNLVFSPDLTEAFFQRGTQGGGGVSIVQTVFNDGAWTQPRTLGFSGIAGQNDYGPVLSPNGDRLFFYSDRAPTLGSTDFWVAERNGSGWSSPRRLPAPINSPARDEDLSVAADGTIYFSSNREGGYDIYRAPLVDGAYPHVERLGASINSEHFDGHPCIAPDQSFLVFTSGGRPDDLGDADLYVSFRNSTGGWSEAVNLGAGINSAAHEASPTLSPDGGHLFFVSHRERISRLYWVDILAVERLKPALTEPVHVRQETVYSSILEEERVIKIRLPEGYEDSGDIYPVLYVLDAESRALYDNAVGTVVNAAEAETIPEMWASSARN